MIEFRGSLTMPRLQADDTVVDVALIARVAARDPGAIATLYDRHHRLLYGLILRILRDRGDAEEVLQEVFLTVWTRVETYDRDLGSPAAWLVRIARNRRSIALAPIRSGRAWPRMHRSEQSRLRSGGVPDRTPAAVASALVPGRNSDN